MGIRERIAGVRTFSGFRYLSVCSGVEAATLAWDPIGFRPIAFSEIAPFPAAVLAHRFPQVPNLGDMEKFRDWRIESPDLVVGGTPCQAFSIAGFRRGLADPRGNLALIYLGILDRFRPRWAVWENVPGVLSSNGGRDFGSFLGGLAELGYGFAYRVLDAQYFGVPQRRRRVFVVAHLGGWRGPADVLFEPESLSRDPAPRRTARKGIASHSESGARNAGEILTFGGNRTSGPIDVSPALLAHPTHRGDFESEAFIVHAATSTAMLGNGSAQAAFRTEKARTLDTTGGFANGQGGTVITVHATQTPITMNDCSMCLSKEGQIGVLIHPRITHTLRAEGADASEDGTGRGTPIVAFMSKDYGGDAGPTSPTLRAMGHDGSHANGGGQVSVVVGPRVRRLTPRECERLQGMPDDWTRIPWRGKGSDACPDGPRYKAIGNSMAVPVMRWIGARIEAVDHRIRSE